MHYTVGHPHMVSYPCLALLFKFMRQSTTHKPGGQWCTIHIKLSVLSPLFSDSSHPSCVGVGLECSQCLILITGGVKDAEGWRPIEREGYRGQNLAAPLLQDVKVGQSVPWMISNPTFWGPIHWKYIYTHALSYIGREWLSGWEREIDKKREYEDKLNWLSVRSLSTLCWNGAYEFPLETGQKKRRTQSYQQHYRVQIPIESL